MEDNDIEIFTKEEKTHEFLKKENIYKKFYNYKGIKALRIFLKLSKEKGENSYNLWTYKKTYKNNRCWDYGRSLCFLFVFSATLELDFRSYRRKK